MTLSYLPPLYYSYPIFGIYVVANNSIAPAVALSSSFLLHLQHPTSTVHHNDHFSIRYIYLSIIPLVRIANRIAVPCIMDPDELVREWLKNVRTERRSTSVNGAGNFLSASITPPKKKSDFHSSLLTNITKMAKQIVIHFSLQIARSLAWSLRLKDRKRNLFGNSNAHQPL